MCVAFKAAPGSAFCIWGCKLHVKNAPLESICAERELLS
jgi:hypothetical protein